MIFNVLVLLVFALCSFRRKPKQMKGVLYTAAFVITVIGIFGTIGIYEMEHQIGKYLFLLSMIPIVVLALIRSDLQSTFKYETVMYFLMKDVYMVLMPIYALANFSDVSWGLREDPSKKSKGGQSSDAPSFCLQLSRFGLVLSYISMNAIAACVLYSPELTALVYLFTVGVIVLL